MMLVTLVSKTKSVSTGKSLAQWYFAEFSLFKFTIFSEMWICDSWNLEFVCAVNNEKNLSVWIKIPKKIVLPHKSRASSMTGEKVDWSHELDVSKSSYKKCWNPEIMADSRIFKATVSKHFTVISTFLKFPFWRADLGESWKKFVCPRYRWSSTGAKVALKFPDDIIWFKPMTNSNIDFIWRHSNNGREYSTGHFNCLPEKLKFFINYKVMHPKSMFG